MHNQPKFREMGSLSAHNLHSRTTSMADSLSTRSENLRKKLKTQTQTHTPKAQVTPPPFHSTERGREGKWSSSHNCNGACLLQP